MRLLRIQRSILAELTVSFLLALVVVTAVIFAGLGLQAMSRTQGLDARFLLKLLPALLPSALAYGMPFALLVAAALTHSRMASDRELVALQISGIHPHVAVGPALSLGAILSLLSLGCNGWVLPHAAQALHTQERSLVDTFLAALAGSNGGVALRQCRLSYGAYGAAEPGVSGVFRDFELDQRDSEGFLVRKILGREARLRRQGDDLVLDSPMAWLLEGDPEAGSAGHPSDSRSLMVGRVESLGMRMRLSELLGQQHYERRPRDVDLPDLLYMVERGDLPRVSQRRSLVELHGRLSAAAAPLLFALFAAAASLHLSPRAGRLAGTFLASLPVILIYFPLAVVGKSLADGGQLPAWAGMWLADACLLAGAALLLRLAYRR